MKQAIACDRIEKWRSIYGYEGFYEVSDQGNICALDRSFMTKTGMTRRSGHFLKPWPDADGYLSVYLCKAGTKRVAKAHRLVCQAFLPNPGNLPQVNHLDRNVRNNRLDNLEWTNAKGNIQHSLKLGAQFGVRGEQSSGAKLTWPKVRKIRKLFASGLYTKTDLAKRAGVSQSAVHGIIRYHSWKNDPLERRKKRSAVQLKLALRP